MSYEYRIIPEEDLLIITGSGAVSSDDIYRVVTAFQKDPAWRPSMKMLVDWRHVTELDVDEEGVARLAQDALGPEQMGLGTPLGPSAAVVLSRHDQARIPMMYHTYLRKSGLKSKIFFSMEEAARWLGISVDRVNSQDDSQRA